ncbi:MAG TPA: nucleotidyltransferase [Streptomyces sp.]|nr:nucleotidyltransferase [Streptomyces sp.]
MRVTRVTPESGGSTARLREAGLPAIDLGAALAEPGHPTVFATVSGAHLYGFPSGDSGIELRGAHLLPVRDLIGLRDGQETQSLVTDRDGAAVDLATHDLRKFARMMLRRNGHVLEQLLSPLVVHTTPAHAELVELAPGVLTVHHARHYRDFADTQWRLYESTGELKPLLHAFRSLLTGIHLMRSGQVESGLPVLGQEVAEAPTQLGELIEAKAAAEHGPAEADAAVLAGDIKKLHAALDEAQAASALPDAPTVYEAVHDLVVRVRLAG